MSPAEPGRTDRTPAVVVAEPVGRELVHEAAPSRRKGQQAERHLRLVRQEARRRANHSYLVVLMGIAGVAAVLMALVALHVLIAENQFKLDNLQQQAAAQQATYEKLRLSVAELESPSRIVSVAEGKLGMQQPGSVTYLPATSTPSGGAKTSPAGSPSFGAPGSETTVSPPSGDANWPSIKQFLSGSP